MSKQQFGFATKRVTLEKPLERSTVQSIVQSIYENGFSLLDTAPVLTFTALILLFIISGVASIFLGQVLAELLRAIGVHYAISILMLPAAPIGVVYGFWKLFKRLGIKL